MADPAQHPETKPLDHNSDTGKTGQIRSVGRATANLSRLAINTDGFTLAEVMIAVTLAFIVIEASYMSLRFVYRQVNRWHQQAEILTVGHLAAAALSHDALNARGFQLLAETNLLLFTANGDTLHYQHTTDGVYRNLIRLDTSKARFNRFSFQVTSMAAADDEHESMTATQPVLSVSGEIQPSGSAKTTPLQLTLAFRNLTP
jgi:hypothetical protein